MNPVYRDQIVTTFPQALHVLDTPESNKCEYARAKALVHTNLVKQICPQLMPVSAQELADHNLQNRELIDQALKQQFEKVQFLHSQLGLSINMFPRGKSALIDERADVFDQSESKLKAQNEVWAEMQRTANELKAQLFD